MYMHASKHTAVCMYTTHYMNAPTRGHGTHMYTIDPRTAHTHESIHTHNTQVRIHIHVRSYTHAHAHINARAHAHTVYNHTCVAILPHTSLLAIVTVISAISFS